jgi:hypothetical protein
LQEAWAKVNGAKGIIFRSAFGLQKVGAFTGETPA